MSGHVAQVFLTDEAWDAALADLRRAVRPGGTLAFESRNPDAALWCHWNPAETLRTVETAEGAFEFWHETVSVDLPLVAYETIARETTTGAESRPRYVLVFRTLGRIAASLERAGFSSIEAYGDWDRSPVGERSPELILIAR
ncbi:hypothetical protein [Kytococcus sedentarius]|uniref:hypothetical protein n=1 Tax=Kytococcus sedentarius TaxID=1276 RepID=UPI00384FF56A